MIGPVLDFVAAKGFRLPLYSSKVQAGFPSPSEDYVDSRLDINEYLIKHPASTFLLEVSGDSMIDAAICEGDKLVVDKSIEPAHGKIVIASVDGQFTVKRLKYEGGEKYLMPENKKYPPIKIENGSDVRFWGVVTGIIRKVV
jgi:DNA polymerase V